jgi:hypothetical protein
LGRSPALAKVFGGPSTDEVGLGGRGGDDGDGRGEQDGVP